MKSGHTTIEHTFLDSVQLTLSKDTNISIILCEETAINHRILEIKTHSEVFKVSSGSK